MNLILDPTKAYKANPVAAKKYNIPKPSGYVTQAQNKGIPVGGGAHTYWDPAAKQYKSTPTGYAGTGVEYQTQQTGKPYYVEPTGLTGAKSIYSPAEKANVTYYNWEPSTSTKTAAWNVPIARYPTAGEQAALTPAVTQTPTYKPRTETVLKDTLSSYISNPLKSIQDLFQNIGQAFQEPFGTQPVQAQGETLAGGVETLTGKQMGEAINKTAGRNVATQYATEVFHPISDISASNLDAYLDTASKLEGKQGVVKGQGLQRIAEAAINNVVTPENVTPKNELAINNELINYKVLPQFYENQQDANLAAFSHKLGNDAVNVPISDQRLDAVQDETSLGTLWDDGRKAPKVISYLSSVFSQFSAESNIPLWGVGDPEKLKAINYRSLVDAAHDLTGEGKYSPADFQRMIDDGKTMRLETSYTGQDQFDNPTFSASWNTDVPYQPPEKKAAQTEIDYWENWQTDVNHYWDSREVADRNARREESWEWSHSKDLEGWGEYYASLDSLKLTPFMNEWASSTAMFNELRKVWETTARGQTWTDFLKGYDFFSKWFEQRPEARGEKPTAFAPILQGASRL